MKKVKKSVCLLLCMTMLLQIIPFSVSAEMPFQDIKSGDWYYDAVNYAYANKMMNGISESKFAPDDELTRAMYVTILGRIAAVAADDYTSSSFSDVVANSWYGPYVRWASEKGIVNGYGNGKFGPDDSVTREQMATMIARYLNNENISLQSAEDAVDAFADADQIAGWAADGVELMRKTGLLKGDIDGNFNPAATATRAEAATLFMRLHQALNRQTLIPEDAIDLGNGDSMYILTDDMVSFDSDELIYYVNNILVAYVDDDLTWEEKESLADSVGGRIAGDITSTANILQINVGTQSLAELKRMAEKLENNTEVHYASFDLAIPSDWITNGSVSRAGTAGSMWWYDFLEAGYVNQHYSALMTPVTVGIIDNGLQYDHPDLIGKIAFTDTHFRDVNDLRYNNQINQTIADQTDYISHGTSVSGVICAKDDNTGITGVAPLSQAYFSCVSSFSDTKIGNPNPNWNSTKTDTYYTMTGMFSIISDMLANNVKIINLSQYFHYIDKSTFQSNQKGNPNYYPNTTYNSFERTLKKSIRYSAEFAAEFTCELINQGEEFLIVQCAGNGLNNSGPGILSSLSGSWASITEDNSKNILKKANLSYDDLRSRFIIVSGISNVIDNNEYLLHEALSYGEYVDLCAPGHDIKTTSYDKIYKDITGTSFAAPMVSGVAALVWSVDPGFTAKEVKDFLMNNYCYTARRVYNSNIANLYTGKNVDPALYDTKEYTYPVVNARLAVEAAFRETCTSDINIYEVITEEVSSWEEAKALCESYGGHLATVTSRKENDYVFHLMLESGVESAYFGLSDAETEGNWKWCNGETSPYVNWHEGEPNQEAENEDYAMFYYKYDDGTWNDGNFGNGTVNDGTAFICEWESKEAYQEYLDRKTAAESIHEADLYTQFLLQTNYCGQLDAHYFNTNNLDVQSTLIDIDRDGIDEALVKVTDNSWQSITLALDIKDGKPFLAKSAYDSGGSMGFETIELRYDEQSKRYVFLLDEYGRAFQAASSRTRTVYTDCFVTKFQTFKSESINMADVDYEQFFANKVESIKAKTDVYEINGEYFTYRMIDNTYVTEKAHSEAVARYKALKTSDRYSMYQGTYQLPFHPDAYSK